MILVGDCVELMRGLEPASVDAIVTDPPYELNFMGKAWDASGVTYKQSTWAEALRVLKPGGHLLAFGGTRTYHRLACAIEDAGFEIRDCLAWMFGSGFPKSLDVSKAIDKAAGVEREVVGTKHGLPGYSLTDGEPGGVAMEGNVDGSLRNGEAECAVTAPATDDARTWQGWGTALKPAHEPIVVARKPLAGTVAGNVLEHGTGALNVDGCRVEGAPRTTHAEGNFSGARGRLGDRASSEGSFYDGGFRVAENPVPEGRWPANVVLDEEAAAMLDEQTGELHTQRAGTGSHGYGVQGVTGFRSGTFDGGYGDSGGASRFFYVAKASRAERNAGFEEREQGQRYGSVQDARPHTVDGYEYPRAAMRNTHPTVKPVALMRWLVRLVTPPGGKVLDPFTGSGTTGIACALEGFDFLGMEQDADYAKIAEARIAFWTEHGEEGLRIVAERERAEAEREAIVASGQLELL